MKVNIDEIREVIQEHFTREHPDFILTKRIMEKLTPIVIDGLEKAPLNMSMEEAKPSIDRFLEQNKVINFVKERQPFTEPIPENVINDVKKYFKDFMQNYSILHIYRRSNHPEDRYLYSITAKDTKGEYACWSSWNQSLNSLNHGHYNISSEQECIDLLKSMFTDLTDETDKYGMEASQYENHDSNAEEQKSNIVFMNNRRGR